MKHLRVLLATMLLAMAVTAAGCSLSEQTATTTVEQMDGRTAGGVAPTTDAVADQSAEMSYGAAKSGSSEGADVSAIGQTDRMIIRNGSIEIRVDDVDATLPKVRAAIKAAGGDVADMSVNGGSDGEQYVGESSVPAPTYATITLRVPADRLDSLTATLAKLGTVVSQSESASDVTEQAIDMGARLKNLRAEESRLRTFLDRTNKVSELLAVEAELSRVRGEIESMDAQLTYLERQAARATLIVSLTEPGPVAGTDSPWFGLREAFARGVQAAITLVEIIITVLVAIAPVLLLIAFVIGTILGVARRHAKKAARAAGTLLNTADEPDPASESDEV